MDIVIILLNVNASLDIMGCFVINRYVMKSVYMEIVIILENAIVIQDGLVKIVTNVYRYQVVPIIMVTVPNLWNVFVNLDMMDIFVLLLLVEMVAMQQQVGVQSQMNVGVKPDGQDLDAKHVYPIPDVKMDTVLNPGNVFVQENSKECFVILYYQIRIPPPNTVTSILHPYEIQLQRVKPHQFYQMEDRLTLITYQTSPIPITLISTPLGFRLDDQNLQTDPSITGQ